MEAAEAAEAARETGPVAVAKAAGPEQTATAGEEADRLLVSHSRTEEVEAAAVEPERGRTRSRSWMATVEEAVHGCMRCTHFLAEPRLRDWQQLADAFRWSNVASELDSDRVSAVV